jgi:hypothetical protein
MVDNVRELVSAFDTNPSAAGRGLRELAKRNPGKFAAAAVAHLAEVKDSHGYRYLVFMLLGEESLVNAICSPTFLSIPQAITVTRLALFADPQFDLKLAEQFGGLSTEDPEAMRSLTILAEVSGTGRLRPFQTDLLSHPNAHVRSKAALLLGRSRTNPNWVGDQLLDDDARVRANAVEALWDTDDPACLQFFRSVVGDVNGRVVTNALVGMYRHDDISSIQKLQQMADNADVSWQIRAAWAMGMTGDVRFLGSLTRLMCAGDPKLRWHAIRATAAIRRAIQRAKLAGDLSITIAPRVGTPDGRARLATIVTAPDGSSVPDLHGTDFFLSQAGTPVLDFEVSKSQAVPLLSVGFAIPGGLEATDSLRAGIESGLRVCLLQKRPFDQWAIQRYASDRPDQTQEPIQFTGSRSVLEGLITDNVVGKPPVSGLAEAVSALLNIATSLSGSRHLVCVGSPNPGYQQNYTALLAIRSVAARVAVHGIVAPECKDPGSLEKLCHATGGGFHRMASNDEIPDVLQRVYRFLLSSYEISYRSVNDQPGELTLQIHSMKGFGEATINVSPSSYGASDS